MTLASLLDQHSDRLSRVLSSEEHLDVDVIGSHPIESPTSIP